MASYCIHTGFPGSPVCPGSPASPGGPVGPCVHAFRHVTTTVKSVVITSEICNTISPSLPGSPVGPGGPGSPYYNI